MNFFIRSFRKKSTETLTASYDFRLAIPAIMNHLARCGAQAIDVKEALVIHWWAPKDQWAEVYAAEAEILKQFGDCGVIFDFHGHISDE